MSNKAMGEQTYNYESKEKAKKTKLNLDNKEGGKNKNGP